MTPLALLPTERFVDLVTLQKYDDAIEIADSLIAADFTSPAGFFLKLVTLNNRSIDYEDDLDQVQLQCAADSVIAICDRRIAEGDQSALVRLYLGSTGGFKMIHALRAHEYLSALTMGSKAAAILEEAYTIDSTCTDLFTGLGNYYYFQSRYGGVLRTVGLVKDRRELGITLLRKASAQSYLTSYAAASSIAWIWIDKEQPDSASAIMHDLLQRYPNNRAFLWCLAKAQKMSKNWAESAENYKKIYNSIKNLPRNNHYNEISCLHSIAIAQSEMGLWEEVIKTADTAKALTLSPDIAKRKSKDLDHLTEMKIEAQKHLERN